MNFDYIALLDHDHLDNGLFLTSFANAVTEHNQRGLILHSDSAYTDRIIQTGVMRHEARIRAIKDLNHRLIALLADQGVSAIGLNGYQREMISIDDSGVSVDLKKFNQIPSQPILVLSSLVYSRKEDQPMSIELPVLAEALKESFEIDTLYLFSKSDQDELIKNDLPPKLSTLDDPNRFIREQVPNEFHDNMVKGRLTTTSDFRNHPDVKNFTLLDF